MAHQEFLAAFAKAQGLPSVECLLDEHGDRYGFQINSRERASGTIERLEREAGQEWSGCRVLDVGCAYGAFVIELEKRGAKVVGADVSSKWLRLAQVNAAGEATAPFLRCDASSREGFRIIEPHGPFDMILLNDVFEHIYDTDGLMLNLGALLAPGGRVYFKIPNGLATRNVLREGHKGVFGLSLLPPDYWCLFVQAPFSIYYRRWTHYAAIFREFGFSVAQNLSLLNDQNLEATRENIRTDLEAIAANLQQENFANRSQFLAMRNAVGKYCLEAKEDLEHLAWEDLLHKYRITFWEGLLGAEA